MIFALVFGLDLILITFLFGLTLASTIVSARKRPREQRAPLYAFGFGFSYLLVGAFISMILSSLPSHDPSIYFFPPGFLAMCWGLIGLVRHQSSEG